MSDRRPIAARSNSVSVRAARVLAQAGVSPNQISIASVFIAGAGASLLVASGRLEDVPRAILLGGAAACIPVRLICNMLDGMVAVEFGKQSRSGAVFNELPDRIADTLLLAAAGYAVPEYDWLIQVGWLAAVVAAVTAYVRVLSASLGAGHDFSGPMAKQQRMALLSVGCIGAMVESLFGEPGFSLVVALILIAAGSLLTVTLRANRLVRVLEQGQ